LHSSVGVISLLNEFPCGLLSCVRNGPPRYWGIKGCEMSYLNILQHAETQGKSRCLSEILGIILSLAITYYAPIFAISQIITRKFMQPDYLLVYIHRNHTKKKRKWIASTLAERKHHSTASCSVAEQCLWYVKDLGYHNPSMILSPYIFPATMRSAANGPACFVILLKLSGAASHNLPQNILDPLNNNVLSIRIWPRNSTFLKGTAASSDRSSRKHLATVRRML
jgi:hypothetical protein